MADNLQPQTFQKKTKRQETTETSTLSASSRHEQKASKKVKKGKPPRPLALREQAQESPKRPTDSFVAVGDIVYCFLNSL